MNTIMRSSRKPIIPRNPDKNEIGGEGRLIKKRKEFLHGKYRDYRIFFQKKKKEKRASLVPSGIMSIGLRTYSTLKKACKMKIA